MTDPAATIPTVSLAPTLDLRIIGGCIAAILVMVVAILSGSAFFLNFTHVMAGVLWTGADLFLGFFVGPSLRASPFEARRAFVTRLTPKTLFVMPTLAIITGTSGWFLAKQLGFLDQPWPQFGWVVAALTLITILTVQGLAILLPTNLRVYFELRRPNPDGAKVGALLKTYIYWVAAQGLCQVLVIIVMAKFATGL
jgi:hypothetical protein